MDHTIDVYEFPGRDLKSLAVTAQVVHKVMIGEQKVFLCDLATASDDELKTALLRGMKRMTRSVCHRFESPEGELVAPVDVMSVDIDGEMRRLAERSSASPETR
ncbi:MAG: hypothetical protein ACM3QU_00135 [Verrucomicrobiota bacterium]